MGRVIFCLLILWGISKGSQRESYNRLHLFSVVETHEEIDTGKGALLLTRFQSFQHFLSVVEVEYFGLTYATPKVKERAGLVKLSLQAGNKTIVSELTNGVSQRDFVKAQTGDFFDRVDLGLRSPNIIWDKSSLELISMLARWRVDLLGEGDVAFYDLAAAMMSHISDYDRNRLPSQDFSEKGFINTFNHVVAQAFMTALFSERLADFIADAHERYNMDELVSGAFEESQLNNLKYGPTDNYVDMINNEIGQELGKELAIKYRLNQHTNWTPALLAAFLNDIQSYFSHAFGVGFSPFEGEEEAVLRFTYKLNKLLHKS